MSNPKTKCGGRWTDAKFRSFVVSALRSASVRWGPKNDAINEAYVKDGINQKTGRKCKLHRCASCKELFPKNAVKADHIDPVIGPEGFQGWDVYIKRMFIEKDGYQVLCGPCHDTKTKAERAARVKP